MWVVEVCRCRMKKMEHVLIFSAACEHAECPKSRVIEFKISILSTHFLFSLIKSRVFPFSYDFHTQTFIQREWEWSNGVKWWASGMNQYWLYEGGWKQVEIILWNELLILEMPMFVFLAQRKIDIDYWAWKLDSLQTKHNDFEWI